MVPDTGCPAFLPASSISILELCTALDKGSSSAYIWSMKLDNLNGLY
jgi:hypothetical protein